MVGLNEQAGFLNVECWVQWSSSTGNIEISVFLATIDHFPSINIHVKHHEKGRLFFFFRGNPLLGGESENFEKEKWNVKLFFTILLFGIKRRKVEKAKGHKRTISFDSSL